jgi:hypothetical protein
MRYEIILLKFGLIKLNKGRTWRYEWYMLSCRDANLPGLKAKMLKVKGKLGKGETSLKPPSTLYLT